MSEITLSIPDEHLTEIARTYGYKEDYGIDPDLFPSAKSPLEFIELFLVNDMISRISASKGKEAAALEERRVTDQTKSEIDIRIIKR